VVPCLAPDPQQRAELGFDYLAHQALEAEREFGALLPSNVIVYQQRGQTLIAAIDPERMLSIVDKPELRPIAADVRQRLAVALARVDA
jgi:uncharacterized protein (DUF302 family)